MEKGEWGEGVVKETVRTEDKPTCGPSAAMLPMASAWGLRATSAPRYRSK